MLILCQEIDINWFIFLHVVNYLTDKFYFKSIKN